MPMNRIVFISKLPNNPTMKQSKVFDKLEKSIKNIDIVIATSARFRNKNIKHINLNDLKLILYFLGINGFDLQELNNLVDKGTRQSWPKMD